MNYQFDFKNKIVVVTGASRGIGRDIAVGFGSLGANVVLVSRNKDQLEETASLVEDAGGEAIVIPADLSVIDTIQEVVAKIKQNYPRIDVLVNNSGVTRRKPSTEVTEEDWDYIMDLNQRSYFFMCQAVGKEMIHQGYGKIVNMASVGGVVGITNSAPYSSSKGGVVLLTKVLASEWAKYNIQVNAVGPGYIKTELVANAIKDQEFLNTIISRTPSKRLGNPDEVVGGVLYLASDLANYVTGHTLMIDGGLTAYGV
ncbi:SDR family NAD(P)-dependent oxidoreductase [Aneurinibacillus danicus]|jgi:NAD(P)-dependent dehydrogenase (short-subunit alcohol dehydrogenase family)|uniref:2-deoxy-D-gluconate 3-dehydrogenase n=1 Tax=Aneurinibacillus danicus TaxID=267746 RepID=A0A511VCK0_9BACL|nr:glucose 1-dehydrogenase [Aneurinibacillus danicus]GEN36636.1 2-deoxy-D-gluconate 3-dehydrogenase [Aneurinibacillus danicus]